MKKTVSESDSEGKDPRRREANPTPQATPPLMRPALSAVQGAPIPGPEQDRKAGSSGHPFPDDVVRAPGHAVVLLECYVNGVFQLLTFAEAHARCWQVHFAWVLPCGWIRWGWDGCSGAGPIPSAVRGPGKEFGFHLLTRDYPLSTSDMARIRSTLDPEEPNGFSVLAARFKAFIPKEKRPEGPLFERHPVLTSNGLLEAAYRVVQGRSVLLIAGLDRDTEPPPTPIGWGILQRPPSAGCVGARASHRDGLGRTSRD